MKSVTRTPCWLTPATITAEALDEVNPHTSERCSVENITLDSATPSSGNTIAPTSGEQLIAASGSASKNVPCGTADVDVLEHPRGDREVVEGKLVQVHRAVTADHVGERVVGALVLG